jgi:hypothetical protein
MAPVTTPFLRRQDALEIRLLQNTKPVQLGSRRNLYLAPDNFPRRLAEACHGQGRSKLRLRRRIV